jgi:Bacterial sugar transferase
LTVIGRMIRACKLDELPQLWNVLLGQMSLVGPRPQIIDETKLYTREERHIFAIRPGITDLASIVFSDESEILNGSNNPDLLYHQIIRPWKNRLALLYLKERSFLADLAILGITVLSLVFRKAALRSVKKLLHYWNADELLTTMASREHPLVPYPPPGGQGIVSEYAPRAPLEQAAVWSDGPDGGEGPGC